MGLTAGFFRMPRHYKQEDLESSLKVATNTGATPRRVSDMKKILFGGRGGRYDQIQYYRHSEDPVTPSGTKEKHSDLITGYLSAVTNFSTSRADEAEHTLYHLGFF